MSVKELYLMYKIAKSGEDWVSFIKERYGGGKKKVPNTNPETKAQYPEVSTSTLYKNDENFRNKLQKEFEAWKGDSNTLKKNFQDFQHSVENLFPDILKVRDFVPEFDPEALVVLKHLKINPEQVLPLMGLGFLDVDINHKAKTIKNKEIFFAADTKNSGLKVCKRKLGKNYIYNDQISVSGQNKGLGTRVFVSQVYHAKKAGLKYIKCTAYGDPNQAGWVGYKVWPKMGYDGYISAEVPSEITDVFELLGYEKPYKVSHLYSLPDDEGVKWWEENGSTFTAEFDLSDDSYSMKTLTKYLEKKASENNKQASILKKDPLLKSFFLKKASDEGSAKYFSQNNNDTKIKGW